MNAQRARGTLSPDPIVKQPSFAVLAAENPARASDSIFDFAPTEGASFVFAPSKEGAERRRAHPGCLLLLKAGDQPLRSAGLALRRSTAAFEIPGAPLVKGH